MTLSRSKPHSPGWPGVPLYLIPLQVFKTNFLKFFSLSSLFLPLRMSDRVAHPKRSWLHHWGRVGNMQAFMSPVCSFKGTNGLEKDMWDRPCLFQFWTWLDVSDKCNFWNNERWKPYDKYSKSIICINCRTSVKMAVTIYQKWFNIICRFFVKKIRILCSSDHPILFKFASLW